MKITKIFRHFLENHQSGGFVLLSSTIASLILTNFILGVSFPQFWQYHIGHHTLEYWINDGLMTIFFLLIGLELERELYVGELSNLKEAILPIMAAIGGMIIPAFIHLLFNFGTITQKGVGIPMATDIAFALAVLSLFGKKIPNSLKIFLTALAIADDLGAVLIIAIFYTKNISWVNLLMASGIYIILIIIGRNKIYSLYPYVIGGIVMWYFMLNSGVHATITGVLLAFAIPFGDGGHEATSARLQHFLHIPVSFFVLPIFALANTCIMIPHNWYEGLIQPNSLGILFGLVIGKPLGILLFSFIAVYFNISQLPNNIDWKHIIGVGFLAGIGFTMSIFVSLLAFNSPDLIKFSQIVVLLASLIAALLGVLWFLFILKKPRKIVDED